MKPKFFSVLLAVLTVALLSACGSGGNKPSSSSSGGGAASATAGPPAKITVAYIGTEPYSLPLWIAQDAGIFQKNGLDVNLQQIAGAPAIAAVVSGQIQVAIGGGSDTVSAAVGGADLDILATLGPTFPGELYAPASIKTIADLKGKKIAVTNPGATFDVVTRVALQKSGLNPDKDVNFIYTGSVPNSVTALLNGAVSASPANVGPDSVKLEQQGFHSIYDLSQIQIAGQSVVFQRSYVNSHHEVTQKFIDSIVEAIAREKKDKQYSMSELAKYEKIDDQHLLSVDYDYYSREQLLPSVPTPKPEYYALYIDTLSQKNEKAKGYDISKILDPSFVQNAANRGLNKTS